jgi:hypothetical protein
MGLRLLLSEKFGLGAGKPNADEFDFGNVKFRAEAAAALDMSTSDLATPGPAFIEANHKILKAVWKDVQRQSGYRSTKAYREYQRTAHSLPTRDYSASPEPVEQSDSNTIWKVIAAVALFRTFG